jgi:hypothetical protein
MLAGCGGYNVPQEFSANWLNPGGIGQPVRRFNRRSKIRPSLSSLAQSLTTSSVLDLHSATWPHLRLGHATPGFFSSPELGRTLRLRRGGAS